MNNRKVLLLEGPGFSEQDDLFRKLVAQGHTVTCRSVQWTGKSEILEFDVADVILLRAPWSTDATERLYVERLASALEPSFKRWQERRTASPAAAPLLVGIGRGALILLSSRALGLADFDSIEWDPALESSSGSWIDADIAEAGLTQVGCWVTGRALPSADTSFGDRLEPWMKATHQSVGPLGYVTPDRSIRLSFVDPLAANDRVQFPDFGYRDLSSIPTSGDVWDALMKGRA